MSQIFTRPIFTRPVFMSLISLSIAFLLAGLAVSGMPASFYQAMTQMNTSDYLCVKNYDAGASVTESYSEFDHLERRRRSIAGLFIHPASRMIAAEAMLL